MWLQTVLLNTFYVLLFIFSTIYIYFKYIYNHWAKENVPYLEPIFPFGNVKSLILVKKCFGDCFADIYNDMKQKSKYFGGFYMFSKPNLIVIDPDIIKTILAKEFAHFSDRAMYSDEASDPLSINLVAIKGLRWKTLRAKMTPTFTSGKMKMMFHTILNCTKELTSVLDDHIEAKQPIDIREMFARLATDTIASCAFGLDCNSLRDPDNDFRKYGKRIFEFTVKDSILNMMSTNCPELLRFLQIPLTSPEVTTFFMNILNQTVEYREKNNVTRKDFLDLMIRLKNKQSVLDDEDAIKEYETGISFNELAAQSFVFFAAGFETSSSALNFCLYELSCNTDIQEKTRAEINKILNQHGGEPTYEAVMELKYMDKVFNEVLRKYPPIPVLARECTADFKMPHSNYTCKKGTEIVISTMGIQRDPQYYPEPDKFDPERFSDKEKDKRHPFTYLPFGEGPRGCIASRFALLQVKIVLTSLLKDYQFSLHPKTKSPVQFDPKNIFLCPVDTIWLSTKKIQK